MKYEVTSPDGKRFVITAPEGATEADIINYAKAQFSTSQEPEKEPLGNKAMRLLDMWSQGATFGLADEVGARVNSWIHDIPYEHLHQAMQDERKQFRAENPKSSLAAELTGGISTGAAGGAKLASAKALQKLSPLMKTATIGGLEGGIYGAGAADRGQRTKGGATGAVAGAVLGPAVQFGGNVAGHLARPVVSRAKHALFGTPGGDARRHLVDTLAREGFDSADSLLSKVPEKSKGMATIADVSQGGRGALEGIVSDVKNPAVTRLAKETLESRNKQLTQRIFSDASEGLDLPVNASLKQASAAIKSRRGIQAENLYGKIDKPLMQTPELKRVLAVDEVEKAVEKASKRLAKERATGKQITTVNVIDEAKRILDDQVSSLQRQGQKNEARRLLTLKRSLIKEVDEQIPEYATARNAYAGDSALLDAGEKGRSIFKMDADDVDDIVGDLADSEKVMFRLGVQKAVREKLMAAREGTNTINRISSQANLEKISKAFPNKQAFEKFKSQLDFEAEIFDTARVLHNSKTALRQAAQREMDSSAGGIDDAVTALDATAAKTAQVINKLMGNGLSDEAREELGKILLTPIKDLPPETFNGLRKMVLRQTPLARQPAVYQFINDSIQAGKRTPTAIGGVTTPILLNQ